HLVDDVDLPAPGRTERRSRHQVAHGLDTVVGGGVELVHVEGRPGRYLHARSARAAGLAVRRGGAVERLGEDASRRCLPRAPGTAEQVGVGDPSLTCRVAERLADMVL